MQFTLVSCGDLFGNKEADKKLENGQLKANCELNLNEFSEIFDKSILESLNCLEKNLIIFMNVSELGKGGKLSRVALTKYLKRNEPTMDQKTYTVIDAIFALSRLITGEEKDYISKKNVELIMDLVKKFNEHAYRHYNYTYGSAAPANLAVHNSHRTRVEAAGVEIKNALEKIYVADRGGEIHFVEIMEILKGFIKEENGDFEKLEGILFVKKILLGGDVKTINHKELGFLFSELPRLLRLTLDVVRYKNLSLDQNESMTLLQADTIALENVLFHPSRGDRRFEGLFNVDVAIDGIDRFVKDEDKKFSKYRVLIKEAVRIFTKTRMDGVEPVKAASSTEEQWVTGKDLEKIISHSYNISNRALAFHKIYNSPNIKPLLDAPLSVELDPAKFEQEFPLNKIDLREFIRIVNSYRYMKGHSDMVFYSLDYVRNAAGTAEIATFEYLIKTFFSYYGSSLSMGDKQLRDILKKFETELIEMDIILPRRTRSTAETIALLGSLFQAQSDDNKVLDVDEAAEFGISLFTAIGAKKKLFSFYDTKNCQRDEFNRMEPDCFKESFIEAICTNYRSHLPRLFEYLGADPNLGCEQNLNTEHNMAYINAAAHAARTCHIYPDDTSEIKYSEGDVMSILLAMMHIETTITRWDVNFNNTMDYSEVMDAYAIYEPAINGMLPDAIKKMPVKIRQTVAKIVYQYLVKFEEAPLFEGKDIAKTIMNLTRLIAKKAPASRKTIAAILRIVSEQGKKKALVEYEANPNDPSIEKPFDCNWLRDPTNIPRD